MEHLTIINQGDSTPPEERVAQLEKENVKLNSQVNQLGDRISKLELYVSALQTQDVGVSTGKRNSEATISSSAVDSAENVTLRNIASIEADVMLLKNLVGTSRKNVPEENAAMTNGFLINAALNNKQVNSFSKAPQTATMKVTNVEKTLVPPQHSSKERNISEVTDAVNDWTLHQVQRAFDSLLISVTPEVTLRDLKTLALEEDDVDVIAAQELFTRVVVEEQERRRLHRHVYIKMLETMQDDRTEFSRLLLADIVAIVFHEFSTTMECLPNAQNVFAFNYGCIGDSKSSSLDSCLWPYQKRYLELIADLFKNDVMNIFDIQRVITIMMDRPEQIKIIGLGYIMKHCGARIIQLTGEISGLQTTSRNAAFPDSSPSSAWFLHVLSTLENGKYFLIPKDVEIEIKVLVSRLSFHGSSGASNLINNGPELTLEEILGNCSLKSEEINGEMKLPPTTFATNVMRPMNTVSLGLSDSILRRPIQIAKRHLKNPDSPNPQQALTSQLQLPPHMVVNGAVSNISTNAKSGKEKKPKNAPAVAAASFVNIPCISEFHNQFIPISKLEKKKKTAWIKKQFPNKKGSDFDKLVSDYLCFALSMKNCGDLAVVVQFFDTMLCANLLDPAMIITVIISDAAKELVRLQKVLDDANQCLHSCAYLLVGIFEQRRCFDWLVSIGKVLSKKRPNVWKSLSKMTVELMYQRFSSRQDDFKKKWYSTGEGREILAKLFMVIKKPAK